MENRSCDGCPRGILRLEKAPDMKTFSQALVILFMLAIVAVVAGSSHTSPLITAVANLITKLTRMVNNNGQ
jgi:hypothetical protein